jgi:hypothetical protein
MSDVLGLRRKTATAVKVSNWWSAGDLNSIAHHCREDVRVTYEAFLRLTFQPVPDRYYASKLKTD